MIIRKPYAFLIKNFRKIHIALLLFGLFVLYKTIDTAGFVNDFMRYGTYDLYADPITNHISSLMMFFIFIMIVGSVSLLFLLLHKKKPWKTYLVPIVVYVVLFFILSMIKSFFHTYTESVDAANLRLSRDLLMIILAGQLPALGIFVMRIFGLDVKKFDFNSDLESLDLSEEDREEIEVSLDFDFNTIKRLWRRFVRNAGYFYKEHKFISWAVIIILLIVFLYNSYVFIFITHKSYRQGQNYNANGYSFQINKAYITDKDSAGNVISNNSNFVVIEIAVKNNSEPRKFDTSNFHLRAGTKRFETTETTYAKEFEDIGTCISRVKELKRDETTSFIVIYKVDKNIRKGRFVLYYQEQTGIYKLRKIKIKIDDISKIDKNQELEYGDFFDIKIAGKEDSISIDDVEYSDSFYYKINQCTSNKCEVKLNQYTAPEGSKIMKISFASDYYEAKNMIDFLKKYGRINYKDSKGKSKDLDINFAVSRNYLGKEIYIVVPEGFETYKDAQISFIVRNKEYSYRLT